MAFLAGWQYRQKLTIDSGDISSDLTDFPVLVKLSVSNFDFSNAKSGGEDIRFTSSDETTLLKFEREYHNDIAQEGYYWVKIPSVLAASDTDFYIYYGNAIASDGADIVNTWDANFKSVWHLKELSANIAGEFEDSTSNNNDGQGVNTPTMVDGQIYKGQQFNGSTQYVTIPDSTDLDWGTSDLTMSFWVEFNSTAGNQCFIGRGTSGVSYFYFAKEGGAIRFRDYNSGDIINHSFAWSPAVATKYRIEITRNGSNFEIYINKVLLTSFSSANSFLNRSVPLQIGANSVIGYYVNGIMDEARITVGEDRGSAWRDASYESEIDDLLTFGVEEEAAVTLVDVNADIRTRALNLEDIDTDIRVKFEENFEDINTDIRTHGTGLEDIDVDVRVAFAPTLVDIDSDIRVVSLGLEDIDTDIRVRYELALEDINTDIRVKYEEGLFDINTDIRVKGDFFKDIDTDVRIHVLSLKDINTDIRVTLLVPESTTEVKNLYFEEGAYTDTHDVTMVIEVDNAISMQFRNETESVYSAFEDYAILKDFTLTPGDGVKTIYSKFKDAAGLVSGENATSITVITSNPPAVVIEAYESEDAIVAIPDSVYQNDPNPFFRWPVPEGLSPYIGFSYAFDAEPEDIINLGIGTVIREGFEVTKAIPFPEMTLDISNGFLYDDDSLLTFDAGTLLLNDGGINDRIDLIYFNRILEMYEVVEGAENVSPIAPDLPEDGIILAEVLVPAGTTLIAGVTITDERDTHIKLNAFTVGYIVPGQHTLKVKAFTDSGGISDVSTFNLYVSNISPEMGALEGYTDGTKTIEIFSNIYQSASANLYLEWTPAPNEPGPMLYYYTTDGSEPTLASPSTASSNLSLGTLPAGYTTIRVKPYDTISENFGKVQEFIFLFGVTAPIDETLVIGDGGTTLKQSLKQIHVLSINFDFDSARICKIFEPVAFDANTSFALNEIVTVVHKGDTLFSGHIKTIERTITISGEGVTYHCTGPRGTLTEVYAHLPNSDGVDSALITFEDVSVSSAVSRIVGITPSVIKSIQNLPSGSNVFNNFQGQTVEQALSALYSKTNYGWYLKPNGSLVSVDAEANNPGLAKFGIYGTTVNSISPQYNVISSNLQFDVTQRYNKAIIEGGTRNIRKRLTASCLGGNYKQFRINSDTKVTRVLETFIKWRQAKDLFYRYGHSAFSPNPENSLGRYIVTWEVCSNNKITGWRESPYNGDRNSWETGKVFPQGTVGSDNIITFPRAAYNYWWVGGGNSAYGGWAATTTSYLTHRPVQSCAGCSVDALVEDGTLYAEVSLPGSADSYGAKTLRLVNTSFLYSEDPDNPRDDLAAMIAFAEDKLKGMNDIKINGTITLDTVDSSWTLDKTVNLINTEQGSWTSLNAKVVGINFNFDQNTTTLELTSEFLK